MIVRTRFAPSPTGFLHVGTARTALFSWLFARHHGGQFLLRIEDTDREREMEGAIGHIIESLKWLGIEWDEGPDIGGPYDPYIQTGRLDIYKRYANQLIESGFAYPDPFSEGEVEELRKKAESQKRPFLYREHRPETFGEWDGTRPLRFKVPEIKRYEWNDLVRGALSAGEEALDDFILIKSDGFPTYNFAHVVDDIEMKVTHVMRGEEFISSTPKFLSLYDALDTAPPEFATLPVILGESGSKKLSKRDGAKDILDYRAEGYLPEAMVNFLALIGWNPGTDQEILSRDELISAFDITRVQKSGGQFDEEKLLFMNREWMRRLSDDAFIEAGQFEVEDTDMLRKVVPILKERAHTFSEAGAMLGGELSGLFKKPALDAVLLVNKGTKEDTRVHLEKCLELIKEMYEPLKEDAVKNVLMVYANTISNEKGGRGAVLWPLRYALSGQERSPDPFTLIALLGKDAAMTRIQSAFAIL